MKLAAVHRDPLAHSDEPIPGARIISSAYAVVGDLELEVIGSVAEKDSGPRRAGVPQRIGQRLLHDPIGRQVHPRRQLPWFAFHGDLDR